MNTQTDVPVSSEQQRMPERAQRFIRDEPIPFGYPRLLAEDIQIGFPFRGKDILGFTILENGALYRNPSNNRLYQMVSLFLRDSYGEETETHIVMLLEGFGQ